jgi:hypothetical protein
MNIKLITAILLAIKWFRKTKEPFGPKDILKAIRLAQASGRVNITDYSPAVINNLENIQAAIDKFEEVVYELYSAGVFNDLKATIVTDDPTRASMRFSFDIVPTED